MKKELVIKIATVLILIVGVMATFSIFRLVIDYPLTGFMSTYFVDVDKVDLTIMVCLLALTAIASFFRKNNKYNLSGTASGIIAINILCIIALIISQGSTTTMTILLYFLIAVFTMNFMFLLAMMPTRHKTVSTSAQ